jgi:hypothetical protein
MRSLVTGGAGFTGLALTRSRLRICGDLFPAGDGEQLAGEAHGLFGRGQLAEAGQPLRAAQLIFELS